MDLIAILMAVISLGISFLTLRDAIKNLERVKENEKILEKTRRGLEVLICRKP